MKINRPQAVVPWIPSRHRYALFRLGAYVRLLQTPTARCVLDETRVLAIDRDQSTAETYAVAALVWLTVASFVCELLSRRLALAAAVVSSVALATLAVSAAVVSIGALIQLLHAIGLPHGPHNINLNSTIMLLPIGLAASYFALAGNWVRVPAWIFLGCIVANGIASIVLFVLRKRVHEAEARCVA